MRAELREMVVRANANSRRARADGRYVAGGKVYDHEPRVDEVLCNPICEVIDYGFVEKRRLR